MSSVPDPKKPNFFEKFDEEGGSKRKLKNWNLKLVAGIAICWSLFQLWYASPLPFILDFGKIIDVPARSLHLAFGLALCFLAYPAFKARRDEEISVYDYIFVVIGLITTLYIFFSYEALVHRQGIMATVKFFGFTVPYEVILGSLGIIYY